MNIVKLQNDLKDLSDQQLLDSMNMGSAPQYLVLSEMQRRKKMRDEASTQAPQNEGTVADEIMGGITQLPMQAPQMASGGLVSFAKGGYAKGEAEACWTNPETGEKMCPPSKPDVRMPAEEEVKKMQQGGTTGGDGVLRLLPADPVADAYTYLQSRGAEIPADMSEQGIIDYANRVRALDENEVTDAGVRVPAEAAPAQITPFGAPRVDYGSGGRGEVMPETSIDAAPTMPMGGGEYTPGFEMQAPAQEGLPGLIAPEGPAPERAVPFLGQVMEAIVPSAQASEVPAPTTQEGMTPAEARAYLADVAPDWYDASQRSDAQVVSDAADFMEGTFRTKPPVQTGESAPEEQDSGDGLSFLRGLNWLIGAPGAQEKVGPEGNRASARTRRLEAYEQREEERIKREDERKANTPEAKAKAEEQAKTEAQAKVDAERIAQENADRAYREALGKFTSEAESGKAKDEYLDYLRRRYESDAGEGGKLNEAMMRMGLAMMASKNPDFLGALGEGGIEGLKSYQASRKSEEAARQKILEEEGAYRRAQVAAEATSPYRAQEFQLKMAKELDDQIKNMSTLDYAMQNRMEGETLQQAQTRIQREIALRAQRRDAIMNSLGNAGVYGMMPQVGGGMLPGWSVERR